MIPFSLEFPYFVFLAAVLFFKVSLITAGNSCFWKVEAKIRDTP